MATRHTTTTAAACTCCDSCVAAATKLADHAAIPPPGLTLANAGAAASIAHANRKPVEFWRPEKQPDAEKAAFAVRGYQFAEPQPVSITSPEVYKAALTATRERIMAPSPPVPAVDHGYDQYAAEQVMMAGGRAPQEPAAVEIDPGALNAATGAVSGRRRRAESAPIKPQFRQEAAYALSAATISHRASLGADILGNLDPSMEAARIHHIAKTNVKLYTSSPPVEIEVAEQKHRDTLRAAAISMAKDMYAIAAAKEPELVRPASSLAQRRESRRLSQSQFSWTTGDERGVTRKPTNLHEAAQKIAAEKLAKMQRTDLAYQQQYYGTAPTPRTRLMTRRLRRRTSSDSDASRIDWERSVQIRNQMSSLQSRLHEIDEEKKRRDRAELMEIARRNVNAAIHDMDEQVYARTGKPSPSMQREWEEKAQERAKAESEARLATLGRIPIGGQRYIDEVDVEEIARSRIQPTLDEITDRVEEQKAREISQRLDEEWRQRLREIDRQREYDTREEEKRQKAAAKQAEKEQKAAMAEKKRLEKEGQGLWSRVFGGKKPAGETAEEPDHAPEKPTEEIEREAGEQQAADGAGEERPGNEQEQERVTNGDTTAPSPRPSVDEQAASREAGAEGVPAVTGAAEPAEQPAEAAAETVAETAATIEATPTSASPKGESRLKMWFKTKVSRRGSKPPPPPPEQMPQPTETEEITSGFTGGAALTGATIDIPRGGPLTSHPITERDLAPTSSSAPSEHDAADAMSESMNAIRQWSTSTAASGAEGRNSSENGGRRSHLRMSFKDMITRKSPDEAGSAGPSAPTNPPATQNGEEAVTVTATAPVRPSPSRANTTERDELRDNFVEEALPPPPSLNTVIGRSSARESRFSEDL
ncbi:hypothetical protein VTN77DRAFT_5303 [Rasamsonia byssochlamydoides]|uniref:uncharacterized protein n=1 Tax=Rasamsonia byssochlamydoides TaxID=89139 RepID=UPI0037425F14